MSDFTKEEQAAIKLALGCTDPDRCKHCKEVPSTSMDGERYKCEKCGDTYYLDYDEMR